MASREAEIRLKQLIEARRVMGTGVENFMRWMAMRIEAEEAALATPEAARPRADGLTVLDNVLPVAPPPPCDYLNIRGAEPSGIPTMRGESQTSAPNIVQPPICKKHSEEMVLTFYDRPGSPPGNGWSCRLCAKERENKAQSQMSAPVPSGQMTSERAAEAIIAYLGAVYEQQGDHAHPGDEASASVKEWIDGAIAAQPQREARGADEIVEACASEVEKHGTEGDNLAREYACETADEVAARIRNLKGKFTLAAPKPPLYELAHCRVCGRSDNMHGISTDHVFEPQAPKPLGEGAKVKETKEYAWSAVRRHAGRVKQFGSWTYAKSKAPALCQVKGCTEVAKWAVNFGDKAIVLCFAHGEDCTSGTR